MFRERFRVTPAAPPNEGILFVDHSLNDRSGHLGHAMVEYAPGKVLAFYADCSATQPPLGHSAHGWMKYKRSLDGGITWSEAEHEPNSKASFDRTDGTTTLFIEKAVLTDTGRIVIFYVQCDLTVKGHMWEPYKQPLFAYSDDQGATWSKPIPLHPDPGRVYDAILRDGTIYVLLKTGADVEICGDAPYYLLVSTDNAESWSVRSTVDFDRVQDTFYGAMIFRPDGSLIAYAYDLNDEHNLKYTISTDLGNTWSATRRCFFEKRIRNPQIAWFGGRYILHGRSGSRSDSRVVGGHLILYTSKDAVNWDEGHYLRMREARAGAYSENVTIHLPGGKERLLIQSSHAYHLYKTNVIHFFLDSV